MSATENATETANATADQASAMIVTDATAIGTAPLAAAGLFFFSALAHTRDVHSHAHVRAHALLCAAGAQSEFRMLFT